MWGRWIRRILFALAIAALAVGVDYALYPRVAEVGGEADPSLNLPNGSLVTWGRQPHARCLRDGLTGKDNREMAMMLREI